MNSATGRTMLKCQIQKLSSLSSARVPSSTTNDGPPGPPVTWGPGPGKVLCGLAQPRDFSRAWRRLGSPGRCDGCPMSAAHPNSLVFGRRSRAVPVCPPPLPSFWSVVGIWEFDAVVVRLIPSRVAPFFSASGPASPDPRSNFDFASSPEALSRQRPPIPTPP